MKTKKLIKVIFSVLLLICSGNSFIMQGENNSSLPKTEILGKEYYIYEVKKGESIYGVAKKNGWDLQELVRLNPGDGKALSKGDRLYYPTGKETNVEEISQPVEINYATLEPIRHKVKKGETTYSISRQYGIPLEVIYKYNPSAKKGVKVGDDIEIPQTGNSSFYYYNIKKGDNLSFIAQEYNTTVEDILKENAGLSKNNFKAGTTIRIPINSNLDKAKTELVEEERISQISGYKVLKNETWEDISEKTGVEVEILKDANNIENVPSKNSIINVPIVETVEIEKTIDFESQKNLSQNEIQELYDSIKGNLKDERIFDEVRIALILDEPNSNKEIDFTRGMLVALAQMKHLPYKINLKVLDGRVAGNDLTNELDSYSPNLIISTSDKTFPLFLADYGNTNNIQILNVFDLKNDLYEDNPSMVQLLPPSSTFNEKIASYLYRNNKRRKLIGIGNPDENDGIGEELFDLFNGEGVNMTLEEFGSLEPDIMESVILYSFANKKEEVADFFTNVDNLTENFPGYDFKIVGRTNWVTMIDDFNDKFEEYSVMLPSRVWIDEESKSWKDFFREYDEMFESIPVRSIPNFAASGYDIAKYFIPLVVETKGDFNINVTESHGETIQIDFSIDRVNNWGGFINNVGYIIQFMPGGRNEKILVK